MADTRTIDLIAEALRLIGVPASSQQLVEFAREHPTLKRLTNGRTPHKTINARISLDILKFGARSQFYRFAPAAYGLRLLAEKGTYEPKYQSEFIAPNRRKQIAKEWVATVAAQNLSFMTHDGMYGGEDYPESILALLDIDYIDRIIAETREDVKQLVSYVYLRHAEDVIAFERGSYTADGGEFSGKQSIGFGGHINDKDIDLFDRRLFGFYNNIDRELHEELSVIRERFSPVISSVHFRGFLRDSTTANGRRHLGLVAEVLLREKVDLQNSSLGIRNLRWISSRRTPNSFPDFEIWSQYLFRFLQEENECSAY